MDVLLQENWSFKGFGKIKFAFVAFWLWWHLVYKPPKVISLVHQLKIVSIFLVWIWANISLQKSIPECIHSSLALKPAHLSAFEMMAAGRRRFANEISAYLVIHPLCFRPILFLIPPPLFSLNWSLWRSLACERAIFISFIVCEFVDGATHTHTQRERCKQTMQGLFFCNLTVCCGELCFSA